MSVHANIEPLEWESDFFSLSTAKLNFNQLAVTPLDVQALSGFQLVQAKVPASRGDWIDTLNALDFQLVEGEVDFTASLDAVTDGSPDLLFTCRVATEQDVPALRAVASEVFRQSRFRAPWYQKSDSGRFYALWVEKAVSGTFDHSCLILEDKEGHPQGFVTLRDIGDSQGRIGLLAVWPGCSNKGVGLELMKIAKSWCVARKLNHLCVATQMGNLAALRLYIRSGASINSTAYWLYR
ncbi:dTDP-4-amino-4,6-dideoxy-D-galactose acyltransferase [Budviciaceae bacterium CWB-B4]|uniref:dTDP-fucosamine acetyltransferase n=1 Tax=Limnobaculum xujianqingii TaxID=2738837 RepID=A0A9D7ALC3_9GAMM|nr:dTDP-4-amino-4,6-dideoxy-D-galactose acyltransferase [Limnobaculum xujianqingii]MBK5074899.1 dTDP-4-amino-4,6-dideoxy-D-galactose acyltransferase [Limnobaculum xujianqingii]MBK5178225.1 dTDP-4-amino-4,6-dideoxy-D-galactose acyltransferase [Limnobaculum xujianqingii]